MENESPPLGFSEIPPGRSKGQEQAVAETKPYPPPDRPVYSVPLETAEGSDSSGGWGIGRILTVTGMVTGLVAVLLLVALFYKNGIGLITGEERIAGTQSIDAKTSNSSVGITSVQIESARTLHILDSMIAEYKDEPEKIGQIEKVRSEILGLLNSIKETK